MKSKLRDLSAGSIFKTTLTNRWGRMVRDYTQGHNPILDYPVVVALSQMGTGSKDYSTINHWDLRGIHPNVVVEIV